MPTQPLRLPAAIAALAAVAVAAPHDPPGAPASPTALFPADTYAVVEFAGLDACRDAATRLGLLRFVEQRATEYYGEPPVAHYAARILAGMDEDLGELGLSRSDLLPLLRTPVALGVSRVTFFDSDPIPSVALVFRADGEREAPAARIVEWFVAAMMREAPDAQFERAAAAGAELQIVRSGRSNGAVAAGRIGDWAVLAANPRFAMDIARTAAGELPSFATAADFDTGSLPGAPLLRARVHTGRVFDGLRLVLPYEADPLLDALGLERLNGLEAALVGGDGRGGDRLFVAADHDDSGVLGRLLPSATPARAARFFPATTLLFGSTACEFGALGQSLMGFVEALPTRARREFQRDAIDDALAEMRREGVPLRELKDALLGVGPELSFAVEPPLQGSLLPTVYLAAALRNPNGADWLARQLGALGLVVRSAEFEGATLRYVEIDTDGGPTLAPAFTTVDGMLLAASSLPALKTALRGAAGSDNLAGQADFQATLQDHPGAAVLGVLRLEANVAAYWDAYGRMVEGLVDGLPEDLGITADLLPTSEELRGMLRDSVVSVTRSPAGIELRSDGSLSLASLLAAAGHFAEQLLAHGGDARRER